MTREEYLSEYGRSDACMCNDCEEYFSVNDTETVREPHGEERAACPYCGSDDLSYDVLN